MTTVALSPLDENRRMQTAILAGSVGATIALLSGREHTRFDNFVIGGLFTAFAAYRDPRATMVGTLLIAGVEGAVWGVTDRLVPKLKDYVMKPPEMQKGLALARY